MCDEKELLYATLTDPDKEEVSFKFHFATGYDRFIDAVIASIYPRADQQEHNWLKHTERIVYHTTNGQSTFVVKDEDSHMHMIEKAMSDDRNIFVSAQLQSMFVSAK